MLAASSERVGSKANTIDWVQPSCPAPLMLCTSDLVARPAIFIIGKLRIQARFAGGKN